MNIWKSYFQ